MSVNRGVAQQAGMPARPVWAVCA